jgi:hypothetical protein
MRPLLSSLHIRAHSEREWWAGLDPVDAGFFVYAGLCFVATLVVAVVWLARVLG